jgi:hypothetical protein
VGESPRETRSASGDGIKRTIRPAHPSDPSIYKAQCPANKRDFTR